MAAAAVAVLAFLALLLSPLAPHLPVEEGILRGRRVGVLVVGETLPQLGHLAVELLDLLAELSDLLGLAGHQREEVPDGVR